MLVELRQSSTSILSDKTFLHFALQYFICIVFEEGDGGEVTPPTFGFKGPPCHSASMKDEKSRGSRSRAARWISG